MLVCVGIPSIDGKVCANTTDSLLAEQFLGFQQGVHFLVVWESGCSLIGVARNKIAKRFLDTKEADCLVMIDSDISWKGGDLAKLAKRPHDVVGCTYRSKTDDVQFHLRGDPEWCGDLLRVDGIPGGFMKISRHALETMKAEPYREDSGREMRNWFPTGMHDGELWGEDYGFCRQWRETGGEVFLDPSIKLRHHGGMQVYTGDPLEWLESVSHA
jgi:hypothetical protein